MKAWVGFDLDGTIAKYDHWKGIEHIGEPIEPMIAEIKNWLEKDFDVKIVTARASDPEAIPFIEQWCLKHIGVVLPVVTGKDYGMVLLYDDRAVAVQHNTGKKFTFATLGV